MLDNSITPVNGTRADPDRALEATRDERAEGRLLCWLSDLGHDDPELPPLVRREHFWAGSTRRQLFDALAARRANGLPCRAADLAAALWSEGKREVSNAAIALAGEFGTVTAADARQALDTLEDLRQRRERLDYLARERADLCNPSVPVADTLAATVAAVERIRGDGANTAADCRTLAELRSPEPGDADELLRHRFLCRGGGLLLVGPTGVGKSSLALQAAVLWALGRECFGIVPARPLRTLLIQAEDDDGDLAEMRDGVLRGMDLTAADRERATAAVLVHRENARTGPEFFAHVVDPRLRLHRPDLLAINPALSYIGGEANSQRDVGAFLRNSLNPLLDRYGCGAIVVHHTNKPPAGKEKAEWAGSEFAYLGGGSAEWANWARAVVALRGVGSASVFELRLAKRGGRVGWTDPGTGGKSCAKLIAHDDRPGVICWRESDPVELAAESSAGNKPKVQPDDLLKFIPESDAVEFEVLLGRVQAAGTMGKHKVRDFLAVLRADRKVFEWHLPRPCKRSAVAYARRAQPEEEESSRPGKKVGNNGKKPGGSDVPAHPQPPEGGWGGNITPRVRKIPAGKIVPAKKVQSEVVKP